MSTGRVVAGLVVFLALLGIGFYVKTDMESREQPPHFRRMVEEMRGMREMAQGFPGRLPARIPGPQEAGEAIERLLAEAIREAEREAREAPERVGRPSAMPEPLFQLPSDGDGPAPAPTFEDPLPIRPKAGGPARRTGGTHDGAYLLLSDDTAWEVAPDHREIALGWTEEQEVLPGAESLENRATGERVAARRLIAQPGLSVKALEPDGRTVVLDDGSVWYVGAEDRVEVAFWAPPTDVVVLPEALLSPLRGRAVAARRVR